MAADHSHRQKNKDGQSSPKQKGDDILWPRKVALSLLQSFWEEEKFLDSLFESHGDFLKLSSRDRNFVRMMVTTAVRRSGQIEDIMRRGFSDPKQKISPSIVRYLMHLGIAQIV
ncbi:MAG: transcription antitermination factor NusB, partial [Pseudomonadota bacterium]|nr:transcription antitermination factor NusB [Pseudomonadota bacterium]